jgi:hypothetical protein
MLIAPQTTALPTAAVALMEIAPLRPVLTNAPFLSSAIHPSDCVSASAQWACTLTTRQ